MGRGVFALFFHIVLLRLTVIAVVLIVMWVQVPLALSRMRSAAALGQPARFQCELWLLSGEDSTFALSQSNLSLLIGLCSIPLQFSAPDNLSLIHISEPTRPY